MKFYYISSIATVVLMVCQNNLHHGVPLLSKNATTVTITAPYNGTAGFGKVLATKNRNILEYV
jgi:hypothetical protein